MHFVTSVSFRVTPVRYRNTSVVLLQTTAHKMSDCVISFRATPRDWQPGTEALAQAGEQLSGSMQPASQAVVDSYYG